jgi:hypothetical protein
MLAILLIVMAGLAISVCVLSTPGYIADGTVVVSLQFRVVDSNNGLPVAGAAVAVCESRGAGLECPPNAVGGKATKGVTDAKGLVTLECRLPWSSHHQGLSSTQVVSIPDGLWLAVDKAGYGSKRVSLNEVAGRKHRAGDWPSPPIHIVVSYTGAKRS